jgi:hypothetical protein
MSQLNRNVFAVLVLGLIALPATAEKGKPVEAKGKVAAPAPETAPPAKPMPPPKKPETLEGPQPHTVELRMWGALSPREIGRVIGRSRKALGTCHQMAVKQGEAYVGLLPLQFKIDAAGKVEEAFSDVPEGQPDPKVLKSCVLSTVRGWKFPKSHDKGPVIVIHPFVFGLGPKYEGGELVKTELALEHVPGQPLDLADRRAPFHGRLTVLGALDSSGIVALLHKEQDSLKKCRSKSVRRGEEDAYKLTMRWAVNPGGGASHIKALQKGEAMYKGKSGQKKKGKGKKNKKGKKKKRSPSMKDASQHAPVLTACVEKALGKWLFPRPTGGRKAIVSVPFIFRGLSRAQVEVIDPPPAEKEMVVYED